MIKINLIREGRAVKGAAAPGAAAVSGGGGAANLNNILILALLIIGVLAGAGYWFLRHNALKVKQDELVQKQAEAQKLETIIKEVEEFEKRKDSLEKRIATINDLKRNQKGPVKIMDRISQDLPDLVWLDKMSLVRNTITLTGRGLNETAIANFVDNIKNDPMFDEPELSGIRQTGGGAIGGTNVYDFDMSFNFTPPPAEGDAAAATGTDTSTTSTAAKK